MQQVGLVLGVIHLTVHLALHGKTSGGSNLYLHASPGMLSRLLVSGAGSLPSAVTLSCTAPQAAIEAPA